MLTLSFEAWHLGINHAVLGTDFEGEVLVPVENDFREVEFGYSHRVEHRGHILGNRSSTSDLRAVGMHEDRILSEARGVCGGVAVYDRHSKSFPEISNRLSVFRTQHHRPQSWIRSLTSRNSAAAPFC